MDSTMDKVVRLMIELLVKRKLPKKQKRKQSRVSLMNVNKHMVSVAHAIKSGFDERKQAHDGSEARQKWLGRLLMIEVAREEKVSEEAKEEAIKSVFDERKQAHGLAGYSEAGSWSDIVRYKLEVLVAAITSGGGSGAGTSGGGGDAEKADDGGDGCGAGGGW
nr:hypothetical protein [Tanacetum cinerariifolium]